VLGQWISRSEEVDFRWVRMVACDFSGYSLGSNFLLLWTLYGALFRTVETDPYFSVAPLRVSDLAFWCWKWCQRIWSPTGINHNSG